MRRGAPSPSGRGTGAFSHLTLPIASNKDKTAVTVRSVRPQLSAGLTRWAGYPPPGESCPLPPPRGSAIRSARMTASALVVAAGCHRSPHVGDLGEHCKRGAVITSGDSMPEGMTSTWPSAGPARRHGTAAISRATCCISVSPRTRFPLGHGPFRRHDTGTRPARRRDLRAQFEQSPRGARKWARRSPYGSTRVDLAAHPTSCCSPSPVRAGRQAPKLTPPAIFGP